MGSILGGGGKSSSSGQSGYSALPAILQNAFNPLGQAVGQYTNPNNPGVTDRFSPLAQTADETAAFDKIRAGFAPTQQSLTNDVSMLMNPFDQFVIDDVNREANSANSIMKQGLSSVGQLNSNRQQLGANDIEQTRLGTIGKLRQGQYNTALEQLFNNIIPQRQADAQGLLGIGGFERGLDTANKQAPIAALQAGTGMISPFTAGGTQTQKNAGEGMLGSIGNLASAAGSAYLAFSDSRLKENIQKVGEKNGIPIYHFNYIGFPDRFEGAVAQDLLDIMPEAVKKIGEYYAVDYEQLGFELKLVDGVH
jgi:hypothetical protein